jgi:cyanophycin synthetase
MYCIDAIFDFYWKKKWKLIRSARRRGFDLKIQPRVPTVGITGSAGKTTTCRMVAHILAQAGMRVGLATTQGLFVGTEAIREGDQSGGLNAGRLMVDPRVQAGVFELARGGLIRNGTVLDAFDVGAVLNVYDNHVGLDGVADREGLARVKNVVVQRARKCAVLNADDPLCAGMQQHVTAPRLCYVSEHPDNPIVADHMAGAGPVMLLNGHGSCGRMELHEAGRLLGSLNICAIPATFGGIFRPAVSNAMFAAAIAHGLGIGWAAIASALGSFQSTCESNPGRMNFLSGLPFTTLLTWADGPQAMAGLAGFMRGYPAPGRKHLMICNVGDRPDTFILDMTRAVAGLFDAYICSDWDDLRGREPGVTGRLLAQGLLDSGVSADCVTIAATYEEALRLAFLRPARGDFLLVVNSDDKLLPVVEEFRKLDTTHGNVGGMERI